MPVEPPIKLVTLGELTVWRGGAQVALPASKKTRALLAYLAINTRRHRRERLCELLWEVPDDPRAALRWSLSKLRPVVNDSDNVRLAADRDRVELLVADIEIDIRDIENRIKDPYEPLDRLIELAAALDAPLLDGLDIPQQELFQRWLTAEREAVRELRIQATRRLALHPDLPIGRVVKFAESWLRLDPFNTEAASLVLKLLAQSGRDEEQASLSIELQQRFRNAGIPWEELAPPRVSESSGIVRNHAIGQLLARQTIQFCTAADGARIAYAYVGDGPPLVKAANWLSHLELDWDAPIWSPLFRELASEHKFVRYDERGNGLSDWDVRDISFEAFVTDLETVVDAMELPRFPLLGISQGASVSIEYAVRHPERVSHLILFGGYAAGWRIDATPELVKEREAVMTLTETGWGQDNPAYRQIFSATFMPSATSEELNWFNEFQRRTTSPENAVRFLSAFGDIDIRGQLAKVEVPTLVIHSLRDRRIPVATGRDIAASIDNAEFVGLESDGHLLLGREPASEVFIDAVRHFISN